MMLERQDLNIARLVIEEGRSLLIAANKWDLIRIKIRLLKNFRARSKIPPTSKGCSLCTISALEKTNLDIWLKVFGL